MHVMRRDRSQKDEGVDLGGWDGIREFYNTDRLLYYYTLMIVMTLPDHIGEVTRCSAPIPSATLPRVYCLAQRPVLVARSADTRILGRDNGITQRMSTFDGFNAVVTIPTTSRVDCELNRMIPSTILAPDFTTTVTTGARRSGINAHSVVSIMPSMREEMMLLLRNNYKQR